MQTQTLNTLHNAIMEAGGKDHLPMLAPGNYVQWKSRIKRYINTKPNHEQIYYCLKNPPYKYTWADKTVPVSEGSSETTTKMYMENYKNVSQDIRDQLNAKAEAVQIILTEIDNDIYSIVDACSNACEMWKAIKRLKQAPGNYIQWKSRIKRYIDTKPNRELIHFCLTNPPYELGWKEKFVLDYEGNATTATQKVFETYKNVTQEIRDQLNAEAEAVQIILTGIDNDIYSTVDACPNACEMWKVIKRLKQGESINVQDLETNLFWEFGKFTSLDGESLESYYSRFYKMMNELTRNQCKQIQELKHVSYHKLYDILKQHQHKVNEIRAEKIAHVANPLALVAQQQQVYHPQTHPTHYNQHSSTRTHQAATRNREKEIVNSSQPIYDQEPSMVDDNDETSKDKEIDKLMALIS
nr:hypothetical protein [Tanacetum cinerariifolium]